MNIWTHKYKSIAAVRLLDLSEIVALLRCIHETLQSSSEKSPLKVKVEVEIGDGEASIMETARRRLTPAPPPPPSPPEIPKYPKSS
ncbi:hypothetical protein L1987_22603 [Smallanthus sonchifolius]|uniref:Uncharacterized protein n=1 Tax=Smallanthus sonchifolius TaxID=185202 RepID=A0ACB9IFH2_9ASTR|nr:hypothetical protein L1987_22603 [Smallanthus sonchifolius]